MLARLAGIQKMAFFVLILPRRRLGQRLLTTSGKREAGSTLVRRVEDCNFNTSGSYDVCLEFLMNAFAIVYFTISMLYAVLGLIALNGQH